MSQKTTYLRCEPAFPHAREFLQVNVTQHQGATQEVSGDVEAVVLRAQLKGEHEEYGNGTETVSGRQQKEGEQTHTAVWWNTLGDGLAGKIRPVDCEGRFQWGHCKRLCHERISWRAKSSPVGIEMLGHFMLALMESRRDLAWVRFE